MILLSVRDRIHINEWKGISWPFWSNFQTCIAVKVICFVKDLRMLLESWVQTARCGTGFVPGPTARLYSAWLRTQGPKQPTGSSKGWLFLREEKPSSKAGTGFINRGTDPQYQKKKSKTGQVAANGSRSPGLDKSVMQKQLRNQTRQLSL